jgi:Eukaryotic-type carbonic anhydrase
MSDTQHISKDQLKHFNRMWKENPAFAALKGNNRAPQKLNARKIYYKGGASTAPSL